MDKFDDDIVKCIEVLEQGGLILYPTDTVWGIGCNALDSSAIRRIFKLKDRPDEKALILLAENEKMIRKYINNPNPSIFAHLSNTKKPTTVIYSNTINLPPELTPNNDSVAIRIPNDSFCMSLLNKYKKPIVSTSANISGNPTPQIFSQIDGKIKNGVDYIVKHRQSDNTLSSPSSIIKLLDEGKIEVIRQ